MSGPGSKTAPKAALLAALLGATVLLAVGQFLLGGDGCKRTREVRAKTPYQAVPAFAPRFKRPLDIRAAPGMPGRLFIVQQDGVISTFDGRDAAATVTEWLDLSDRVLRANNEEGLLGLAFHPDFAKNRRAFVYFSMSDPGRNVVAEITASSDGLQVDPKTLRVLLDIEKPYGNHNGGALVFGKDGMLYIGVGDGGAGGDPHDNAQNLGTLLGKILRINVDVDGGDAARPYGIPGDNPFVGHPGARPEVWAYGLRNPWRMGIDSLTGELWTGDVGQDKWEEIDVLTRGGNFGWNRFEGTHRFGERPVTEGQQFVAPVYDYGHDKGVSVTGGLVYRGKALPELVGKYIYGDFAGQKVWALTRENSTVDIRLLVGEGCAVSSFGTDSEGELLMSCFDGSIRRLEATPLQ